MEQIINADINDLEKYNLEELFELCSNFIKKNIDNVENKDKLYLYKYYKQATIGNINIPEPSWYDFVGKEKYKAWKSLENKSKRLCMENYIKMTKSLLN